MTQLPDYFVGARYRPARKRGPAPPPPPPPNLGFPVQMPKGAPAVEVPLRPDLGNGSPLYLQWTDPVVAAPPGDQEWGHVGFYVASTFATGATNMYTFQFNTTNQPNTFYVQLFHGGGGATDFTSPPALTGDKCVATLDAAHASLTFRIFHNGVLVAGSQFTFTTGLPFDTVELVGPYTNMIALDHIPASVPV